MIATTKYYGVVIVGAGSRAVQPSGPDGGVAGLREGPACSRAGTLKSTPIFESKGLAIRPAFRGDLLPSKQ
jgi:hypothetical protein